MAKRVTIMIEEDLDKKIRVRQSKEIAKTQGSYSYSRTIGDLLRKAL